MTKERRQLQFGDVDGLAFAAAHGKFDAKQVSISYVPHRLGPLLEVLHLAAARRLPPPDSWLTLNGTASLTAALGNMATESWITADRHLGFIRTARRGADGDDRLTGFLMSAKRAGREISELPAAVAGQLVGAMEELENNIHEHADSPETGILAFRAEPGAFEFVAADRGMGILQSLRSCPAYEVLADAGKALEFALTDGVSRHGPNSRHGHGFRPIFTGLMNLYGELRFRSGDHALTMDGTSPALATARIAQKAPIDGFFASVRCHAQQQN